jgi:hypothetical protein
VSAVLERGDDSEIAATTAQCPEQVAVVGLTRNDELAVGGDDVGREEAVAGHPVGAAEPSLTASERETTDARGGDDPARRGKTEYLRLTIKVAPGGAATGARRARRNVHADAAHVGKVDDHSAVAGAEAGDVVATATNGER